MVASISTLSSISFQSVKNGMSFSWAYCFWNRSAAAGTLSDRATILHGWFKSRWMWPPMMPPHPMNPTRMGSLTFDSAFLAMPAPPPLPTCCGQSPAGPFAGGSVRVR